MDKKMPEDFEDPTRAKNPIYKELQEQADVAKDQAEAEEKKRLKDYEDHLQATGLLKDWNPQSAEALRRMEGRPNLLPDDFEDNVVQLPTQKPDWKELLDNKLRDTLKLDEPKEDSDN